MKMIQLTTILLIAFALGFMALIALAALYIAGIACVVFYAGCVVADWIGTQEPTWADSFRISAVLFLVLAALAVRIDNRRRCQSADRSRLLIV